MSVDLDWETWLQYGLTQRWVSPPVCYEHDGIPSTVEEDDAHWDGEEVCVFIMRCYASPDIADAVEANHAPSVWRKPR